MMTNMKLGVCIEETWDFFNEIYGDFQGRYQTSLFKRRELSLPFFRERINSLKFRSDIQKFLRKNDVVFFEWSSGLLAAATKLEKACGIVTRLHRYELYQWVDQINWDLVDKVVLVSKAKQLEFGALFPAHAHKTVVISPSTSLEKFAFCDKSFEGNLGILCHLTPRKRVYDLVLSFYELIRDGNNLYLHIAGGGHPAFGDYYGALHSLVKKLNLQDRVFFYGHVSETWDWYRKIDIFISNSYSEGLQVAPMEAMASGCFCISHFWDGAEELLPLENLFLGNEDLKKKIMAYCDKSESEKHDIRHGMRELAVEKFDIDQTKKQICEIVEEVGSLYMESRH